MEKKGRVPRCGFLAGSQSKYVSFGLSPKLIIFSAPLQYLLFDRNLAVKSLSFVGLQASSVLTKAGPGYEGLGTVPTLLTSMYAVAALRHVRLFGHYKRASETSPITPHIRSIGSLSQTHTSFPSPNPCPSYYTI